METMGMVVDEAEMVMVMVLVEVGEDGKVYRKLEWLLVFESTLKGLFGR
jgi:hypothetical protein